MDPLLSPSSSLAPRGTQFSLCGGAREMQARRPPENLLHPGFDLRAIWPLGSKMEPWIRRDRLAWCLGGLVPTCPRVSSQPQTIIGSYARETGKQGGSVLTG